MLIDLLERLIEPVAAASGVSLVAAPTSGATGDYHRALFLANYIIICHKNVQQMQQIVLFLLMKCLSAALQKCTSAEHKKIHIILSVKFLSLVISQQ